MDIQTSDSPDKVMSKLLDWLGDRLYGTPYDKCNWKHQYFIRRALTEWTRDRFLAFSGPFTTIKIDYDDTA